MKARALALCLLLALLLPARKAHAQDPPPPPFAPRTVTWAWSRTALFLSASYREVVDAEIIQKINSGIPTLFVFSALLFEKGSKSPLPGVLAIKSCRVVYDVWDEVYAVEAQQTIAGAAPLTTNSPAVANLEGVLRKCAQVDRISLVERSRLKIGGSYEVKVIVEVNPISEEVIARIKRWISRPKGSSTVGAGDALFGSFVGLFVAQIGNADRVFRFLSQNPVVVPPPPPPPK